MSRDEMTRLRAALKGQPDGTPECLVLWVIKQAIYDLIAGNGHSEDAREFLMDDGWAQLLDASREFVAGIREFAATF